jgi:uncharacterized protein YaiE (UPF0345 family)
MCWFHADVADITFSVSNSAIESNIKDGITHSEPGRRAFSCKGSVKEFGFSTDGRGRECAGFMLMSLTSLFPFQTMQYIQDGITHSQPCRRAFSYKGSVKEFGFSTDGGGRECVGFMLIKLVVQRL